MKAQNIIFKRESFIEDESKDVLNLYDENNNVVATSDAIDTYETISIEYEGFIFLATPEAKEGGEDYIFVPMSSIKKNII